LLRKPGTKEDFVRGKTSQFPFTPGGLENISEDGGEARYRIDEKTQLGPLLSIPPGFTRGLKTKTTEEDVDLETTELEDEEDGGVVIRSVHLSTIDVPQQQKPIKSGFEGIDDLLPDEVHRVNPKIDK
jgi:antiviral helicase SKI2